jgi:hypothetical protein
MNTLSASAYPLALRPSAQHAGSPRRPVAILGHTPELLEPTRQHSCCNDIGCAALSNGRGKLVQLDASVSLPFERDGGRAGSARNR